MAALKPIVLPKPFGGGVVKNGGVVQQGGVSADASGFQQNAGAEGLAGTGGIKGAGAGGVGADASGFQQNSGAQNPPALGVAGGTGVSADASGFQQNAGAEGLAGTGGIKGAGAGGVGADASGFQQNAGTGVAAGTTTTANAGGALAGTGGIKGAGAGGSGVAAGTTAATNTTANAATGANKAAYVPPIRERDAGEIVDDLSKMAHGGAVSNKPGWSWYHDGQGWTQAPTGQDPKIAGSTSGGTGTGTDGGTGTGETKKETAQDAFEKKLLELLNGQSAEEAGASAGTSVEANAYRAGQQRNQERTRAQLAEENAIGGGDMSNPGLERAIRGLDQQAGESEGQFVAQLAGQKIKDRRDELFQAMAMQAEQGNTKAARELQLKIAEMDKELRNRGFDVQTQLGQLDASVRNRGYDVQESLGNRDLDLRRMLGLLGLSNDRYGVDRNRDNNLDRLGYDYTALGINANKQAASGL